MTGFRAVVVALAIGLALGCTNSLVNAVGGPYAPHPLSPDGVPALMTIGAVLGTGWAWCATGFVIGLVPRRWWMAPLLGAAGLLLADLAYYTCDFISGVESQGSFSSEELTIWAVPAVGAGVVFGLLGWASRRLGPWGAIPLAVVGVVLWRWCGRPGADVVQDAAYLTQRVVTIVLVAAVALLGPLRRALRR